MYNKVAKYILVYFIKNKNLKNRKLYICLWVIAVIICIALILEFCVPACSDFFEKAKAIIL